VSGIVASDPQLSRLAQAIALRVGSQRYHVWFNNSTRLDFKQDGLEIAVPNDFIGEWIGRHFAEPIQEAAQEVFGCRLPVKFWVAPELFEPRRKAPEDAAGQPAQESHSADAGAAVLASAASAAGPFVSPPRRPIVSAEVRGSTGQGPPPRLRHCLDSFVVGPGNQLAHTAATCVADAPGTQYNPLFIHGACGLGKTHLLQGLCRRSTQKCPTQRWTYLTGEEFTNDFITALRANKLDQFRRRMRDLDLLVIDDVHFLSGKVATQEEFLHTFNAIEAMGRQIVIASDNHPKMIAQFGESLVNRFVSGMVVRIDPPNHATRCQILRQLAVRHGLALEEAILDWIARRVTQNVRELEGAITRISANVKITGMPAELPMVQEALGDLDRQLVNPIKPENIIQAVCQYFGLEMRDLLSSRRQRTISLARSTAMHLIRKTAKLSFPEIGVRLGKRNHSTVISACRRIDHAIEKNERLNWNTAIGERSEDAGELLQRLEELSRTINN
jgi:chromosomal replication initiator protein